MKKFCNIDQIVSVEKHGKGYGELEYRPAKRGLFEKSPSGYWNKGESWYHGPKLPENFSEDEDGVYRKPRVRVRLSDGSVEVIYFDKEEWCNDLFVWLNKSIKNTLTIK